MEVVTSAFWSSKDIGAGSFRSILLFPRSSTIFGALWAFLTLCVLPVEAAPELEDEAHECCASPSDARESDVADEDDDPTSKSEAENGDFNARAASNTTTFTISRKFSGA